MAAYPEVQGRRLVAEIVRAMINTLVVDLTETTRDNLQRVAPGHVDDVRQAGPLVSFSPQMRAQARSEEHTSELQSRGHLVCRLLLEKKKQTDHNKAPRR